MKPFVCPAIGCNQQFAIEDHLEVHRRKHEMSLGLRDFKSSLDTPVIDQTPTPTRFLKNCEEVGLFSELPNPFDAEFRNASTGGGGSEENTDVDTDTDNAASSNDDKIDVTSRTKEKEVASLVIENVHSISTAATTIGDTTSTTTTVTSPSLHDVSSTTTSTQGDVIQQQQETIVVTEVVESALPGGMDAGAETETGKAQKQLALPTQQQHVVIQRQHQQQQPTIMIVSSATATTVNTMKPTLAHMQAPQVHSFSIPTLNTIPISAPILLRLPNGQTIPVVPPSVSNPAYNIPIAIPAGGVHHTTTEPQTIKPAALTVSAQGVGDHQANVKLKLKNALLTSQSQGNLGVMSQAVEVVTRQQAVTSTSMSSSSSQYYLDEPLSPESDHGMKRRSSGEHPREEVKRQRFLERNRAAATRCRNKRKQWITNLEDKANDLNNNNNKLQNEVTVLRNEVAQLKELLLAHKECPVTVMQRKQQAQAQLITGHTITTAMQSLTTDQIITTQPTTTEMIQIVDASSQPETFRIVNAQEMVSIRSSANSSQPEMVRIVNAQPEVIEVVSTADGQRAIAMKIEQTPGLTIQTMAAAHGAAS